MTRLNALLTTVVALVATAGVSAQPAEERVATPAVQQLARTAAGTLQGVVSDDAGTPIDGVTVSAIGVTMAFAVTDEKGRFTFEALPAGQYLLRAHRSGFSLQQREYIQVRSGDRLVRRLELRRGTAVGTAGSEMPEGQILAAAFGEDAPPAAQDDDPSAVPVDPASPHPHTEAAWRLRHARRSVLKDATEVVITGEELTPEPGNFAQPVPAYASMFSALPFSTEINLLTTSAFGGSGEVLAPGAPRGITYVQLGSEGAGEAGWAVQAAVSQGDISSWVVAGSFTARGPLSHAFDTGLSFGAQEYSGGNPATLAVPSNGMRSAGAVYAFDNWSVSPGVHLAYGAQVSRYDYLERENLWSPRVALSMDVARGTHVRAAVSQRFRAPGAEEFLPPQGGGTWLPPERTFSPLAGDEFRVERIRQLELTLERELANVAVVAIRRFFESVDDQMVTIFGADGPDGAPADVGHYFVGTAGAVDADGWGVRVSSPASKRLRGAVDYALTRANWALNPSVALGAAAPSAVRAEREDVHDVATSVEADISETATRVFFYYRISTGYARDDEGAQPALGGRFDLQVKQALPFMPFRGSQWQVLVGIRDVFRDPLESSSSTYDELLVVRPPKRVIGGVQVKF